MLATNANRAVTEFLDERRLAPARERADAGLGDGRRQSVEHGAPARAVSGSGSPPACRARLVTDEQIRATIRQDAEALGYVWDPHGATAAHVYHHALTDRADEPWVLLATAHPAKFNEIVEPLIGRESRCHRLWRACCACRGRRSVWRRRSTRYARGSDR